jgi:Arc/MetJ-type ribon-helix-helix transcriptional regulator
MMAIELPILRIAAMTITLKPETERLINEELKSGHYKDAEEVIQRALQTLHATHQAAPSKVQECQEAAVRICELRKGVILGGLKIKDLIHEGHKY